MGMQGIMDYPNLKAFISSEGAQLCKGPVALLFIEDDVEVESTLDHHINLGFKRWWFLQNLCLKLTKIL